MKLFSSRLMTLLALSASALFMAPSARAATSANGDILLGVRASSGTGTSKTFVINLGPASQFENASSSLKLNLGNVGTDLTSTFGASWNSRSSVLWGIAGTVGSFSPIGANPPKTVYASKAVSVPWTRGNDGAQGGVTNSLVALSTAFNTSPTGGATATNAVIQNIGDTNSWASYQPGGNNAGPDPGYSFGYFNPNIEANFGAGVGGAILHFYRVRPATTGGEVGANGDYLGRFVITSTGEVTFVPVAAFGVNSVSIQNATYSVNETAGTVDVKVLRGGDLSSSASVSIAVTGGTAASPDDFSFTGGAVTFGVGEAEVTKTLSIVNRSGFQNSRTVVLGLSSPIGATLGATSSTTVTINENITTSTINLVDSLVTVGAESDTVTINLERTGGSSPVTVDIATTDDTAVAGVDYTTPIGGAQTVTFGANETTATASIALTSLNNTTNKKFSVSLTNAGANASIGDTDPTATVVRILAVDALKPAVTITSPTANQVIQAATNNTAPNLTISGTATDNVEVDKVEVSFNGGNFVAINTTGATPNWNRVVQPVGGVNTISVRAVDARGNVTSPAVTRSFTYVKSGSLAVTLVPGDGSGGTVAGVLGANAYEVGKTYTLTATPKTGFAFFGWTVPGLTGVPTQDIKLTFVYTEAILASPTITATFIATPFADANKIGDFNGLVIPHSGTTSSNSTNGAMKLTITKTGSFSGSLLIDGFKLTIPASALTGAGYARFGATRTTTLMVARTTKPSLELSDVHWDSQTGTITGVVKQYYRNAVIAQSDFTLDRAAFSSANKLPSNSPYLANAGLFTVILPAKAQTNGLTRDDYPQGDGVGSITVSSAGVVTFSGKLADDTAVTASAPLSVALKAPLFAQLYSTKGSYSALVALNSDDDDSDLKAVDSLWFRPWQNAQQWYPWGWEEGVTLDLLGAAYVKTGSVIKGVQTAADTVANADLVFSDGLLTDDINAEVNINTTTNAVKNLTTATQSSAAFSLKITTASGDISGTFTHTDATKPKFVGKVYQKGTNAGAYGYFLSSKPKVVDGLGQSGGVSLNHR